jgi:hypothetical protein
VSHFWRSKDDPDPDSQYLRLLQGDLAQQEWSYIWVDWTCLPQHPRTEAEERYFRRGLETMPAIIRNSGFVYYYPPFEPRLWILYEVAEYSLTCTDPCLPTPDIQRFAEHVNEMLRDGVRSTLDRHGYRCSYDWDQRFLTSWLEVLVLLRKTLLDIDTLRDMMDKITWWKHTSHHYACTTNGVIELNRFEGRLIVNGDLYTFTPFPEWVSLRTHLSRAINGQVPFPIGLNFSITYTRRRINTH